ncbi:acyl-CoA dehydrogenase family protein [Gordonia liuliyuniae]|uniref:Acyl-CoA/acyl-ACP dehydrogenase n=1 Tax=Gordonia liuliyuniae TaxID=2911517 RepID=A0ABS9IP24_9ACTN|nr:acyl-CoA dehydrogenase family protein [Gordonia liuliyuniae]MCF8587313.1 acyl-CoA/acyl-ACP dehydrogenase [Gordonia liuliyuniae]
MDFELSDEQTMLREVSRSMLAAHCTLDRVRAVSSDADDIDDGLWRRGVEMGWTGLPVPDRHGGSGMGLVESTLVAEEIGRALAPTLWNDTAIAAWAAAAGGAPDEVIAALAEGDQKAALVIDTGFVHAAPAVDWLLAVDDSVRLIRAGSAHTLRRTTLDESRRFYSVSALGETAHQLDVEPQRVRDAAAVLIAADSLGVGEVTMRMTADYVKVRKQFDRPIGSFQVVKHKIADMLIALDGVRAATHYAAMAFDAGLPDASSAASVAKAFAAEKVSAITSDALQTHGGIGFTWEHDLHLYLRRATTDEFLGGSAAFHHDRVATLMA